jgi:hypothetical protein
VGEDDYVYPYETHTTMYAPSTRPLICMQTTTYAAKLTEEMTTMSTVMIHTRQRMRHLPISPSARQRTTMSSDLHADDNVCSKLIGRDDDYVYPDDTHTTTYALSPIPCSQQSPSSSESRTMLTREDGNIAPCRPTSTRL